MGFGQSKEETKQIQEEAKQIKAVTKEDERAITYGKQGHPISMFSGDLDPLLLKRIQESEIFNCEEKELTEVGFMKCVDYPHIPEHTYYEGYFHGKESAEPTDSINPRTGQNFPKPPGPRILRAFYAAFRLKNEGWINGIAEKLREIPRPEGKDRVNASLDFLVELFTPKGEKSDWLFGDLAIQVHFGHPIEGPNIGFHTDSLNSLLHLATAVRGKRALHFFDAPTELESKTKSYGENAAAQEEGDIYVSAPTLFRHGVHYPESDWENRTVAIQARFLLDRDHYGKLLGLMSSPEEAVVARIIAEALVVGLQPPTLAEVEEVEKTLEEFNGSLKLQM